MARGTLGGMSLPVYMIGGETPLDVRLVSTIAEDIYDPLVGALLTIDVVHHEIHEGHSFVASCYNASVANLSTLRVLIKVGNLSPHTVYRVAAGGDSTVTLYEGVTTTLDGTVMAVQNLNRNSPDGSTVLVYHTPTIATWGSVLETQFLPGGTGVAFSVGSEIRRNTEWLMQPNVNYIIEAVNISGGNQPVSINLEFYTFVA